MHIYTLCVYIYIYKTVYYSCVCVCVSALLLYSWSGGWNGGIPYRARASAFVLGACWGLPQTVLCAAPAAAHINRLWLEDVLWQVKGRVGNIETKRFWGWIFVTGLKIFTVQSIILWRINYYTGKLIRGSTIFIFTFFRCNSPSKQEGALNVRCNASNHIISVFSFFN